MGEKKIVTKCDVLLFDAVDVDRSTSDGFVSSSARVTPVKSQQLETPGPKDRTRDTGCFFS